MLRIGEVAELAGVSTRTIRHYHQIGLLPEPARMANGYRGYELRDVVVLLRVRRLAELGLRLDEVGDVLADDKGRELRDILVELDADLAELERRTRLRRQRIAELLATADADTFSGELADLLADLEHAPDDQAGMDADRLVTQMFGVISGALVTSERGIYRVALADRDVAGELAQLAESFRGLAGRSPDDPTVVDVAARAASVAPSVLALVPKEIRAADKEPPDQAMVDPAQARCRQLLLQFLRDRA